MFELLKKFQLHGILAWKNYPTENTMVFCDKLHGAKFKTMELNMKKHHFTMDD